MKRSSGVSSPPSVDLDAEADRWSGSYDDEDSSSPASSDNDPIPDDFFGIRDWPDHDGSSSESWS